MGIKEFIGGFFQLTETREDVRTGKAERMHRLFLSKKASEAHGPRPSELIIEIRKTETKKQESRNH